MRTVVFGIDGLAFRVLDPMIEAGYLPNFQALARDGVRAALESKYPPFTPPAWMSIATGLKPAGHGVYDFWAYDEQGKDYLVTSRKGGKAIWNILSDYGKRVLVLNVPLTYPPEPVNGVFVSGFPGASEQGEFTYPRAFRDELLANVPAYRVDIDQQAIRRGERSHTDEAVLLIENRLALMRYLMSAKEWDFAFVVYRLADHLQHKRWPEITALAADELRYYRLLDEALGVAREMAGPDGNVFVVSDHGFQGTRAIFAVNEYLYRHGWLHSTRKQQRAYHLVESLAKVVLRRMGLLYTFRQTKRHTKARLGMDGVDNQIEQRAKERMVPYLTIEEERAAGVCMSSWSGVAGAYAVLSITQPLSAERLAALRGELLALRDPRTGQPLLDAIYSTEDFGTGPYAPETECLLLLPSDGITFTPVLGKPWLWEYEDRLFGTHQKDGIFYASGPAIRAGMSGPQATPFEVFDVMPTVLRAMQLPVPEDTDGRVLDEIFVPSPALSTGAPAGEAAQSPVARKLEQLRRR